MPKSPKPLDEDLSSRFIEELMRVYHVESLQDLNKTRVARDLKSDPATISKVIAKKMEPSKEAIINAVKFIHADGNYIMAGKRSAPDFSETNQELYTLQGELKAYKDWYGIFMKDIRDLLLKLTK